MNGGVRVVLRGYALLVSLYPRHFRLEFGEEMQAVFGDAVAEAAGCGIASLFALFGRELRDWPHLVLWEYWRSLKHWTRVATRWLRPGDGAAGSESHGRWTLNSSQQSAGWEGWGLQERRQAVVASLPPLLFGLGLALATLVIGRVSPDTPPSQLVPAVAMGMLPAVVIGVGGLFALVRRVPEWSYAWLGATLMECFLLVQVIADELAEDGITPPPAAEAVVGGLFIIALLAILGVAARRGWAQAGLVSIGMATIMGLSMCQAAAAAPFHRHDVVVLAGPFGLLFFALSYAYVRGSALTRLGVVIGLWCLNAAIVWMLSQVWQDWLVARSKPSPALPFLVLFTCVLLAGPVIGLLGQAVRRIPRRA